MFRAPVSQPPDAAFTDAHDWDVSAFQQRKAFDLARYVQADGKYVVRRAPFHQRLERWTAERHDRENVDEVGRSPHSETSADEGSEKESDGGEEAWRNSEGERLKDFGVDEVADFYDEDDVPLAELMGRRRELDSAQG